MVHTFDYIIVGGGTSGSVVANRLSENPDIHVLLLESGGDSNSWSHKVPALYWKLENHKYSTTAQDGTSGRVHHIRKGRCLGGSSATDAMIYNRGLKEDYEWGVPGWDGATAEAFFTVSEKCLSNSVEEGCHGSDGDLPVSEISPLELSKRFVIASDALGLGKDSRASSSSEELFSKEKMKSVTGVDINNGNPRGAGFAQILVEKGYRASTSSTFLNPLTDSSNPKTFRPNLHVITNAHVSKLIFDGPDCVGVKWMQVRDGVAQSNQNVFEVRCEKEVIVCAGAIETPKLLMLSGIGPERHLRQHDIDVKVDLPVGQTLRDQVFVPLFFEDVKGNQVYSMNLGTIVPGMLKFIRGKGALSSAGFEAQTFLSPSSTPTRTLSLQFLATRPPNTFFESLNYDTLSLPVKPPTALPTRNPYLELDHMPAKACGIFVTLHKPRSTGSLQLKSTHPLDQPVINPNYLNHDEDFEALVDGCMAAAEVAKLMGDLEMVIDETLIEELAEEKFGYFDVAIRVGKMKELAASRGYVEKFVRRYAVSGNEPNGTCAMGSVVDEECRVMGVEGLRVCGKTVLPRSITGSGTAPSVMLGERVAAFIDS